MKTKHLLLVGLVVAFSSCSTAYRTGQTPDDVYYSPAPVQETYVVTENQDDRNSYVTRNQEEQDIRRGISDQRYRNQITFGSGYGYNPYSYNSFGYNNFGYNNFGYNYNPYSLNPYAYKGIYDPYGFNPYYNYYSPYYGGLYNNGYYGGYYPSGYGVPVIGKINTNTGARKYNLRAYNNPPSNNNNNARTNNNGFRPSASTNQSAPVRTFKQPTKTGVGNVIRRVFTPSESRSYSPPKSDNRSYNYDNNRSNTPPPSRSFSNPPSSNNNNRPSSSAPVRTFRNN